MKKSKMRVRLLQNRDEIRRLQGEVQGLRSAVPVSSVAIPVRIQSGGGIIRESSALPDPGAHCYATVYVQVPNAAQDGPHWDRWIREAITEKRDREDKP